MRSRGTLDAFTAILRQWIGLPMRVESRESESRCSTWSRRRALARWARLAVCGLESAHAPRARRLGAPPRPPSLRPPAPCFLAPPRRRRGGASRTSAVLPGGSKRPPERKHVSTNGSATFLDIWPCFRLLPVPMRAREGGSTVPGVRQHRRLDLGDEPVGGPLLSPPGRQPGRLGDGAVRRGGGRRQRRPDRRLQGAPRGERVRRHPLRPCFGSPPPRPIQGSPLAAAPARIVRLTHAARGAALPGTRCALRT